MVPFRVSELKGSHAGVLFEETGEERGIGVIEFLGDLEDAHFRRFQQNFGFLQAEIRHPAIQGMSRGLL